MRALVEGEGTALVLYRIDPNRRFAAHRHPFPEYGTMVAGRGRLLLETGAREVREGDSYFIPSGLSHGFESHAGPNSVVMLHVAVGLATRLRASMFRHLVGRTQASLREAPRSGAVGSTDATTTTAA
jgi:hypothetical protein